MASLSRRQIAAYAVDELLAGQKAASLAPRLAAALIANKMPKQADLLLSDISEELESRGLLAQAVVTSVNGLSAELKKRLASQIKSAAKVNQVFINERTDPAVIGGLRVETARHTWDQTVARKLAQIKGGI